MEMPEREPPAGFARHTRPSGLTDPWQPIFASLQGTSFRLGLFARPPHANGRGFVHGGLITALADNAMGLSVAQATEEKFSLVTVSIAIDFIGSGQLGQWIEFRPRVLRTGSTLGFVDAQVLADEALIARANATFRMLPRTDRPGGST